MKISEIRTRISDGDVKTARLFCDAVIAAITEHVFDEEEDPLGIEPVTTYLTRYGVEFDRNDLSRRDYRSLLKFAS